jgi:hypothetical protein
VQARAEEHGLLRAGRDANVARRDADEVDGTVRDDLRGGNRGGTEEAWRIDVRTMV